MSINIYAMEREARDKLARTQGIVDAGLEHIIDLAVIGNLDAIEAYAADLRERVKHA